MKKLFQDKQFWLSIAFLQVLVAIMGSLYFSNIAGFVPCDLCWFQRICMYPMIVLFGVALAKNDYKVWQYALPLASIGWLISLYHNVMYYNRNYFNPSTSYMPCSLDGTSCTTKYIEYFGFVTIPLLAFTAFSIVIFSMIMIIRITKKSQA